MCSACVVNRVGCWWGWRCRGKGLLGTGMLFGPRQLNFEKSLARAVQKIASAPVSFLKTLPERADKIRLVSALWGPSDDLKKFFPTHAAIAYARAAIRCGSCCAQGRFVMHTNSITFAYGEPNKKGGAGSFVRVSHPLRCYHPHQALSKTEVEALCANGWKVTILGEKERLAT